MRMLRNLAARSSEPGNPMVVVVTGATGYIASHIVKRLLDKGLTVRATVRDTSNQKRLKFLTDLPGAADRLTFYKADLLLPGAFDEAVAGGSVAVGATHVIHTASPVPLELATDPYTMVVAPAVEGTKNVFESIKKSSSVRRVILTSSIRAVFGFGDERPAGYVYDENDWNLTSTLENNQAYALSKTLAERIAWQYCEEQSSWDLIAIHPGLVFGPTLSGREDSLSITLFKNLVTGHPIVNMAWGVVDVRDVATAHVAAILNPEAKGRYMCCSETLSFLEIVNTVRSKVRRFLSPVCVPKAVLWLAYYSGATGKQLAWEDIAHNINYPVHFSSHRILADLLPEGFIAPATTFSDMYDSLKEFQIIAKAN